MGRDLSAFISYRRRDAYLQPKPDGSLDFGFIDKLAEALKIAGFKDVFVDTSSIEGGQTYDSKIRKNILDCDLFIAVIGGNWLDILRTRQRMAAPDDVVREIRIARAREKAIIPLLIDGTGMPPLIELPEQIRRFHFQNGVPIKSTDSAEAIAATLKASASRISRIRSLISGWTKAYFTFSCLAYLCCAILPNVVGWREFGRPAWTGMASVWSGFYIWPIVFLLFILVALYRPLTTLVESVITAPTAAIRRTYAMPLVAGTVLSVLATAIEVAGPFEVPWSIHPVLPGCAGPSSTPSTDVAILSSYDSGAQPQSAGPLQDQYGKEFWMVDKCWPNVFYYLTVPVYEGAINPGYLAERPAVQRAFKSLLTSNLAWSETVRPYVVSFWILAWLGGTGIVMSIFFVMVQIRRPEDDDVLRLPGEDAYLCLTYSFVALVAWLPFRMNTLYFKKLYSCETLGNCSVDPLLYFNDGVLGSVLIIAYAFVTTGLLIKYRRLALAFLGSFSVATILLGAFAVYRFGDKIAEFSGRWQFYAGIAIPLILIMTALWYLFDPATRDVEEFDQEAEKGGEADVGDGLDDRL
jgi:hypothetical protein